MASIQQNPHPAAKMAWALSHGEPWAMREAAKICTDDQAADSARELSGPQGRALMGELLESRLDASEVRDALLNCSKDSRTYGALAAGFAAGAIASCQERADLLQRAGAVAVSLIEVMPSADAKAFHARAIATMAHISKTNPAAAIEVADHIYPKLADAIDRRGSSIADGLFELWRNPIETPAGVAAMFGFEPALSKLAERAPVAQLEMSFKRLAEAVAPMKGSAIAIKNIDESLAHCVSVSKDPAKTRAPAKNQGLSR